MAVPAARRLGFSMKTLRASPSVEGLACLLGHFFRICISFSLLFVDNTILLAAVILSRLRYSPTWNRRQAALQSVHFYPKTVLITGIGTPQGLALARAWDAEGHRVVGADVTDLDLPIRSGGSMSRSVLVYYRVPKDHYISRILDIVHREKVDVWIPCSPKASAVEDATARQVIESRTNCRCIAFDAGLAACFIKPDSFRQFLAERDLPVLERHQVRSRDSIHKILHRSPTKSYRLSSSADKRAVILPKRTLSTTYAEVSEIKISEDSPWVLQQQHRLGEVFADLLVVRGHVHAINIRLAGARSSSWGASRLDEALAAAVHRLMQTFAEKGGPRMTGHLSVRLLVDEEFDASSVRHTIHIADCVPGAAAIESLLRDARCPVGGYLSVLSSESSEPSPWDTVTTLSTRPHPEPVMIGSGFAIYLLSWLLPLNLAKDCLTVLETELLPLLFWKNHLFSPCDPLPWWWEVHIYQPLREIWVLLKQTRAAGLTGRCSHN